MTDFHASSVRLLIGSTFAGAFALYSCITSVEVSFPGTFHYTLFLN